MTDLIELRKHSEGNTSAAFFTGAVSLTLMLASTVSVFSPSHAVRYWGGLAATAGAVAFGRKTEQLLEGAVSSKELSLHTHEAMRRADVGAIYKRFSPSELLKPQQQPLALPADAEAANVLTAFDTVTDGRIKLDYKGRIEGPAFIRILVDVRRGTSVKDLPKYADDLKVKMALDAAPLIATYAGAVGVDIPRHPSDRRPVYFRNYAQQRNNSAVEAIYMLIGIDLNGQPVEINFADPDTPHLLAAGMTGSGKSEWMRACIASIVNRYPSDEVKIVLSDMKGTKFNEYRNSAHLYNPLNPDKPCILTEREDVIRSYEKSADDMDERYRMFRENGCENFADWNRKMAKKLPRILIFCDEFDDLMIDDESEERINLAVRRLGKKAREAGIHIGSIISQRPSKKNVSMDIKANIPARVALKVANGVESQIILGDGVTDAKDLLGRGDLLYYNGGEIQRLHSAYIPEHERMDYVKCPVETKVEDAVGDVMRLSPEEKELRRKQQELEQLWHKEAPESEIKPTSKELPSFLPSSETPLKTPKKGVNPDLLKYMEVRKLRESGMPKTGVVEHFAGTSSGRKFQEESRKYDELMERYGDNWAMELIGDGKEDKDIILLIWLSPSHYRRALKDGTYQRYVDRLAKLRQEFEEE